MGLQHGEILIDDSNARQFMADQIVRGERKARGAVPRNYATHPHRVYGSNPPSEIPLIPQSEWSARIKEMEGTKGRLSDIRDFGMFGNPVPSLDQNGQGFCWAYSTGTAQRILRAYNNQHFVDLSPHAVACKIKGFRDEGGWGSLSLEWAIKTGYPSSVFWPQKSMSRQYDTAETWNNAALHKVSEDWADLSAANYDRSLTFAQVMTLLLCRIPVITDFNWWSHSVCAIDPVEVEPGSFGIRIWNSWGDSWSDKGMGVLRGDKAHPDGAVAPRAVTASAA